MVGGVDALLVVVAALDPSEAYWSAAAATAGSLIGSLVLFYIARRGGEAYLVRYTAGGRGARLREWFRHYGLLTVFVPAFVPVIPMPVKVFILSAGAMGVSPWAFTLVILAARIPRYIFLAWIGIRLGNQTWPYLRHHLWQFALLALALFALLYLSAYLLERRRRTPPQ